MTDKFAELMEFIYGREIQSVTKNGDTVTVKLVPEKPQERDWEKEAARLREELRSFMVE